MNNQILFSIRTFFNILLLLALFVNQVQAQGTILPVDQHVATDSENGDLLLNNDRFFDGGDLVWEAEIQALLNQYPGPLASYTIPTPISSSTSTI